MVITGTKRGSIRRATVLLLALAVAASIGAGTVNGAGSARPQEFRGRVVSVDRAHMTFRVQSAQGSVRVRINRETRFAYGSWAGMRAGMRVDVHARRVDGRWVASRIERWHHTWSHDMWGDDGWHDSWSSSPMHDGWDDDGWHG